MKIQQLYTTGHINHSSITAISTVILAPCVRPDHLWPLGGRNSEDCFVVPLQQILWILWVVGWIILVVPLLKKAQSAWAGSRTSGSLSCFLSRALTVLRDFGTYRLAGRGCCCHGCVCVCLACNCIYVGGRCQSNLHMNARTQGLPAEHCIVTGSQYFSTAKVL